MQIRFPPLVTAAATNSQHHEHSAFFGTLRRFSPYRRTNSFFRLPQILSSQHFFALASFRALRVICCAPPHHPSTPLRHLSPPFNLHRARVRRNHGRLPSNRCIESAQTRRARALTLLHRASDTTLGLPITNRGKRASDHFRVTNNLSGTLVIV